MGIEELFNKFNILKLENEEDDSIKNINERIEKEVCNKVLEELSDLSLMDEYKESNSVKENIKKLGSILDKHVDEETKEKILISYLTELIPAGTKGVIRGNKFNEIIKKFIIELKLDNEKFEICFEKKHDIHITDEIPDWYIFEKSNNKIMIGMNQLDLWSGGAQSNRGTKYLINNRNNNENSKLVCVVCNPIKIKHKKKAYDLFKIGFENDTLCYINNLENIIKKYFELKD
jgi:hypothetical protein